MDHYTQDSFDDIRPPHKYRWRILTPDGYSHCSRCGKTLPIDAFYPAPARPRGVTAFCISCTSVRRSEAYHSDAKVRESRRAHQRKYMYGLTPEQFDVMMAAQEGTCAICRQPFKSSQATHIDHCHTTGRVRGILCAKCNRFLYALDDKEWRTSAEAYLDKHKE